MKTALYNSSESGYLENGFEGISYTFTDIEVLWQTKHNTLARAKKYGRWWMLKSINQEFAKQTIYQQMMRKELEMLMRLQHPYIVQVVGIEEVHSLGMCIVMEYVDGVRLDEWLSIPRSKNIRLRLAKELLGAVEYMHSKGIVHRDLKPGNILVTRNGENIKLIDLGLADSDHQAILKQPAGTLDYVSPEQMEQAIPDVRNDVYSLGKVLQHLLPEHEYKGLIRKCLLSIEYRFQNVTFLIQAIHKQERRKNRLTMGITIGLMMILSIGFGIQTWRIQQIDSKRQRIEKAINLGMRKVEGSLMTTGIKEHLDTLTSLVYLIEDFNDRCLAGYEEANRYFDSIRPSFSHVEMAEIMNAVTLYCAEEQNKWIDKIDQLR